jgi:hypothetical protein
LIHLSAELAIAAPKVDRLSLYVHPADVKISQERMISSALKGYRVQTASR